MKDLVEILSDHAEKVGTMNVRVLAARDAESAGYAHYMAKMLSASEAQREENRKLAEIRKQRHGIDPHAQQPSTLAIMARPKEDDLKHFLRPLPMKDQAQIVDKDGNVDVAERKVNLQEISHIEAIRRRPKNSQGQGELSSVDMEKRERAVHAYLFSKPAELTFEEKQRITQIAPYSPPKPIEPERNEDTKSLAGRLMHWFWKKGLPVQRVVKKNYQSMRRTNE